MSAQNGNTTIFKINTGVLTAVLMETGHSVTRTNGSLDASNKSSVDGIYIYGQRDADISLTLFSDSAGDAVYDALLNAYYAQAIVEFESLNTLTGKSETGTALLTSMADTNDNQSIKETSVDLQVTGGMTLT